MLYAVYERGELDGRIVQATKTYGQPDYGKILADHAMPYVEGNHPTLISDEDWYVKTSTEELCERPHMAIDVGRNVIKAGGSDSCVARGLPKGAFVTVTLRDGTVTFPRTRYDATELEILIPVPCTYRVFVDHWPYKTFTYEVEAVA